jgi:hypothetical protein
MSWRRRLLASLPLVAAALWLTTAAASAQALGLPSAAPLVPTSAPKVAETVNKQAVQPAVHVAQPAVNGAQSAQQTAAKAAQPVKQTVDQATKQTNAAVSTVAHTVEKTVQTALATAPAPVPSPPSVPTAPEIPALSPVVDTLAEVVAQVVAPIAALADETDQPAADTAVAPVALPVVQAQVRLPVATLPAVATPMTIVVAEPTTDTTNTRVTDTPVDEEIPPLEAEASSDVENLPTPVRFVEINAVAAFPQPALVADEPVIDVSSAPAEDAPRADVDTFEPLAPVDATHGVTLLSPTPEPATPLQTKMPGSIGLPNTAAAGQLPSLTPLPGPDIFRGVWPHARRLPSVIVLPNLAPPG